MNEEKLKHLGIYWKKHDAELIKDTLTQAADRMCKVCAVFDTDLCEDPCGRRKAILAPLTE